MREDIERVLCILPPRCAAEIRSLAAARRGDVYEIRVRRGGGSVLVTAGGRLPLSVSISNEEMERILLSACDGAIYARRDGICQGYIPYHGGVRVGVCGRAAYDGGRIIGVGGVSTLVFRFPAAVCSLKENLYLAWQRYGGSLLIASPPGGGKTTALVSLAATVAERERGINVAVVDERCEISERAMPPSVDILSGYDRRRGIEIAYRTLSADVIFVDEIATEAEAEATLSAFGVGVRVVATAHGRTFDDLRCRRALGAIFSQDMLDAVLVIERHGAEFSLTEHSLRSDMREPAFGAGEVGA